MKHPLITDKLQIFIAKTGFVYLTLLYILITVVFGTLVSACWCFFSSGYFDGNAFLYRFWYSFVFLYGYQPELKPGYEAGMMLTTVFLSIGSVIFPTILLGTIVFKALLPRRRRVIFRNTANIYRRESGGHFIAIHCYLGSRLYYIDWYFKAYIRVYFDDRTERFPLRSYPINLEESHVPLPYTLMPTRILIPIAIEGEESQVYPGNNLTFRRNENGFKLLKIGEVDLSNRENIDFEFIILTSGKMPELGMDFMETKTFHHSDINFSEEFEIETTFDMKSRKGSVSDWKKF